jgi:predicted transcriptional regulator
VLGGRSINNKVSPFFLKKGLFLISSGEQNIVLEHNTFPLPAEPAIVEWERIRICIEGGERLTMNTMERRRSNIEVIADMLRLGEAGKTEIMYSANLSYFQLQKYLNFMLKLGLINKVTVGNPMVTYRVTRKGLRLLRNIDSILEVLELREED